MCPFLGRYAHSTLTRTSRESSQRTVRPRCLLPASARVAIRMAVRIAGYTCRRLDGARWAAWHRRLRCGTRPGDGTASCDRSVPGTVGRVRRRGAGVCVAVPRRFRSHRGPVWSHSDKSQEVHRFSFPRRCTRRAQQAWNRAISPGSCNRALEVQRHDQLVGSSACAGLEVRPPIVGRQRPRYVLCTRLRRKQVANLAVFQPPLFAKPTFLTDRAAIRRWTCLP